MFTEDTTPGKPKFGELEKFSNAILVRWLPPDNIGLVCVTGYSLEWGENSPFQFSSNPLSGNETQYLIKELSKCKVCVPCFKQLINAGLLVSAHQMSTSMVLKDCTVEPRHMTILIIRSPCYYNCIFVA